MIHLPHEKTLYRVDEVALLLDVTERSVRRWIEYGRLKSVKVAGIVRIEKADLAVFLGANSTSAVR